MPMSCMGSVETLNENGKSWFIKSSVLFDMAAWHKYLELSSFLLNNCNYISHILLFIKPNIFGDVIYIISTANKQGRSLMYIPHSQ
jgi:hypothetical protein